MSPFDFILSGRRVIEKEATAVSELTDRINEGFSLACELILACRGRVIVTGIGKSGHIANKLAATLASTGTPSFFVHPGEASHGDFGMVTREDLIIAISNSGSTSELLLLIPMFKRLGNKIISLSGNTHSPLAEFAEVNLDVSVKEEACSLNLAPTSSTTAALAMGDAIAVALLEARGFSSEDFAFSHPGGSLGRKLIRTEELMHANANLPIVHMGQSLTQALAEITSKGFGMTVVLDAEDRLAGIFTDGDLRRCVRRSIQLESVLIDDVMTASPRTISKAMLAAEALNVMESNKITALIVTNDNNNVVGVIHMHDLLRAGIY